MNKNASISQPSRRGFMKTAGLVSAGIAASSTLTLAQSANVAGSDVIKVGLIGCGGRGMGSIVDRLKVDDAIKIVALGDLLPARVAQRREELANMEAAAGKVDLSADRVFSGFDSYKGVTELADVVHICSPAGFHPDHYLYAVEQGKHVFMEKPFCVDAEGYRRCMKANKIAEEKGLTVCAGFQRRHESRYREWIARIHAGAIGDVVTTRVYWNGSSGTGGRGAFGPGETELMFQIRRWYVFNWLCGDHIVEQHCHNLDIGNWIHGKGDPLAHPVSCVGHGGRQVRKTPRVPFDACGNIFDHHYVEYRYADGSVMLSTCRQIPNCWDRVTELVSGTKGRGEVAWLQPTDGERWNFRGQNRNPYEQEHVNQAEAMRKGERLHDGWHAATSTMIAIMGRMATYSGQEIQWNDAVAKGKSLFPYDVELTADTAAPITLGPDETYEHDVAVPGVYDPFDKT